ncbi:MAG: ribonuclease III, partial [Acetobacteraceae bacterium]
MTTGGDLTVFAARLGHAFAQPELLVQALTHRSAADPRRSQLDSNERLEFLGDRVLALLIAEWLAERFPEEREGDLGKRLGVLVARDTLARVAENLGLAGVIRVPTSEGKAGLRERANVLADAVEALLGALYMDAGLPAARALVRREWEAHMGAEVKPPMSAKSRLQEYTLGRGLG